MGKIAQEKHTLLNAMVADNISTTVIAKTLNYTPEHTSRLKAKSKAFQLITTRRVKTAAKAIDHFIDLDNYHEDAKIKPSDVIAAANVYLSRSHPIMDKPTNTGQVNIYALLNTAHNNLFQAIVPVDNPILPATVDKSDKREGG